MKKRYVLKKGKEEVTRKGSVVISLSKRVMKWIKPYSKKAEVAGSIRRHEKNPVDIDIVVIPKNREKFEAAFAKHGKFLQGGDKKSRFRVDGVNVEFYYTVPEEWGATLMAYSSKFGAGIGLRVVAKKKGFKLNQHGLFDRKTGKRVAGKTERQIYHALGRPWKKPEDR